MLKRRVVLDNTIKSSIGISIDNVDLTPREKDVISCLISGKSSKSTALILDSSYKTIETHIRNISQKIRINSREALIAFVENSSLYQLFKDHYLTKLADYNKRKLLTKIANSNQVKIDKVKIFVLDHDSELFAKEIINDISVLGYETEICNDYEDTELKFDNSSKELHVIINKFESGDYEVSVEKNFNKTADNIIFDSISYTELFTDILKYIYPDIVDEEKISEYITVSKFNPKINNQRNTKFDKIKGFHKRIKVNFKSYIITLVVLLFVSFVFIKASKMPPISNLIFLPQENHLERNDKIQEIDNIFNANKNKNENVVIAIIGIGGSGKTTLASDYAKSSGAKLAWELNARNLDTLIHSYRSLLETLTLNDEETYKKLMKIIKNSLKEDLASKIFDLVQEKISEIDDWVLILDNVTLNPAGISQFIPIDKLKYGNGKILITARDENIDLSIPYVRKYKISELNKLEKTKLFRKISHVNKDDDVEKILDFLPPYPLDIRSAAYYIKTNNLSLEQYINALTSKFHIDSDKFEKELLDLTGSYKKTRKEIFALSVSNLINQDEEFENILFFISLINHQFIQIKLLKNFYNESSINDLIFHLQKNSFITNTVHKSDNSYISIHESFHEYLRKYFRDKQIKNRDDFIIKYSSELERYLKNINRPKTSDEFVEQAKLLTHVKFFANNIANFTSYVPLTMMERLGVLLSRMGQFKDSEKVLLKCEKLLSKKNQKDLRARVKGALGSIYLITGENEKSEEYLKIYLNHFAQKYASERDRYLLALCHLSALYRTEGEYDEALKYVNLALDIAVDSNKYKWIYYVMGYKGMIYNYTKEYDKAEKLLSTAFEYFNEKNQMMHKAWIAHHYGHTLLLKKNYKKSIKYLRLSYDIHRKTYGDYYINTADIKSLVGLNSAYLGDTKKGIRLLEESLKVFQHHYKNDHYDLSYVYEYMGIVEDIRKNKDKAIEHYLKAYDVLRKINHPDTEKISVVLRDYFGVDLTKSST